MAKKIFLTGGNSFIGKNLIEQLGNKYDLVAPKSSELDLTDAAAVKDFLHKTKPEIVIHAANTGGKRNQLEINNVVENNLKMFFNLVRGKEYFERMIVLGSGAEYDKSRSLVNVREEDFDECVPRDQYGFSKYVMSKYAEKVDYITHLRLFGVYGKYEDHKIRFVSNMICRALYDLPLNINQNSRFDYLLVDDLVKIIDLFITKKSKETLYNVASGLGSELTAIARLVNELMDKKSPITCKLEGLNREYTCDVSRFKNEFPDFQVTNCSLAVEDLISYYRENKESIIRSELLAD